MTENIYPYDRKVVVMGGGTGEFTLLRGLVKFNNPEKITAMPGTWDSGGSSGRLRTELGSLPVGDIRQCLIGLMENERQQLWTMRESDDRFLDKAGPLKGHDFLNLELDLLMKLAGGTTEGIDAFREKYLISGQVIPSSLLSLHLIAKLQSGKDIYGEAEIDERWRASDFDPHDRINAIYLNTQAEANYRALEALDSADDIIISSGSLWTSIIPHLLVEDVAKTILRSRARVTMVLNLMTERGQTDYFSAADHLQIFLDYLGDPSRLDYLVINQNGIDPEVLNYYKEEGKQEPIEIDEELITKMAPKVRIASREMAIYSKRPYFLRHDPLKLAEVVLNPESYVCQIDKV